MGSSSDLVSILCNFICTLIWRVLLFALASTGPGSFWPVIGLSILPYVLAPFLYPGSGERTQIRVIRPARRPQGPSDALVDDYQSATHLSPLMGFCMAQAEKLDKSWD